MKNLKIILCIVLCLALTINFNSCDPVEHKQKVDRKYDVRLSNWVGSDWYECDSVIWLSETHIQLINKEDNTPFMDIVVPEQVIIRVSLNINKPTCNN